MTYDSTIQSVSGDGGTTCHSSMTCWQSLHSNQPRHSFSSDQPDRESADAASVRSADVSSSSGDSEEVCICMVACHASLLNRQCVRKAYYS